MTDKVEVGVPRMAPMPDMQGSVELNIKAIFDTLENIQEVVRYLEKRIEETP